MSHRRYTSRSSRRSASHVGGLGAFLIFVAAALGLGWLAAQVSAPDGVLGAAVVVLALVCWTLAGRRVRRGGRH